MNWVLIALLPRYSPNTKSEPHHLTAISRACEEFARLHIDGLWYILYIYEYTTTCIIMC